MDQENNKLNETNAEEIVNPEEVKEVVTGETETPEITPQNQTTLNFVNGNPPPKKKKKFLIPVIIGAVLAVLVAVFFILTSTHVICLEHEWNKATCTEPKTCEYCGKTDGEAKGHEWVEATCLTPKTCSRCDKTEGEPVGHKEETTIIDEPTLIYDGKAKVTCSVCDELNEEREIPAKQPAVEGRTFNFTRTQFTEWLTEIATLKVTWVETEGNVSSYYLTADDGDVGAMTIACDSNGKVCDVMMYFEDVEDDIAIITFFAEKIDPSIVKEDAAAALLDGKEYKKAGVAILRYDLNYGEKATALMAQGYYDEVYES